MTTPAFTAGDMIEATLIFESTARTSVYGVTAYCARQQGEADNRSFEEKEANEKIWLKGTPIQESVSENSPTWRVVLKAPLVEANEEGFYQCHFIEATYAGARKAEIQNLPNISFRIQHEDIPAPMTLSWEWTDSEQPAGGVQELMDRHELMQLMENAQNPEEVALARIEAGKWSSAENYNDRELETAIRRFEARYPSS